MGERKPAERRPERTSDRRTRGPSPFVGDEFGSGVEEPMESSRPRHAPPERRREEPPPPPRKPVRRPEPTDDFEGDLFVDDLDEDIEDDAAYTAELDPADEAPLGSEDSENELPRRRRRRRRRGRGRAVSESTPTREMEFDDSIDADDASASESEEDLADPEVSSEDEIDREEGRESRRPRRRRRRRGRRPETTTSVDADAEDALLDEQEIDEEQDELLEADEESEAVDTDEEVVVPVSYEGIPTWEEAISYLVIVPPTESRGHQRGRDRRDDSRRR